MELLPKSRSVTTAMMPADAAAAHLRHLSKEATAKLILSRRFHFAKGELPGAASRIAMYIRQALRFYEASGATDPEIRPVLQYYCYSNLAQAALAAFRPKNHGSLVRHGISDRTHSVRSVSLGTVVAEVTRGVVPAFHALIAGDSLEGRTVRLKDLVVPLPFVTTELQDAFRLKAHSVEFVPSLEREQGSARCRAIARYRLGHETPESESKRLGKVLESAFPILSQAFSRDASAVELVYRSKDLYESEALAARVWKYKFEPMRNQGWCITDEISDIHVSQFLFRADCPLIPAASAAMMFSFVAGSMARYRPELVARLESSRVFLLFDVFVKEVDRFMLPMFRNLLYREQMHFRMY